MCVQRNAYVCSTVSIFTRRYFNADDIIVGIYSRSSYPMIILQGYPPYGLLQSTIVIANVNYLLFPNRKLILFG